MGILVVVIMIRTVMFPLDMSAFSSSKEKAEMAADFVSKAGLSSNTGDTDDGDEIQIQIWVIHIKYK